MDEQAFVSFYRLHAESVLAFLARRTGDPDLAADLTAEVFADVLRRRDRYDPTRGDGRSWVLAIAAHKQVDAFRRGSAEERARRRLRMRPVEVTEDDRALIAALGSDVETAVSELSPDQRDAVTGRVLDDLSYDELARRADVSPAAIRQRVARGLANVRTRLEDR